MDAFSQRKEPEGVRGYGEEAGREGYDRYGDSLVGSAAFDRKLYALPNSAIDDGAMIPLEKGRKKIRLLTAVHLNVIFRLNMSKINSGRKTMKD